MREHEPGCPRSQFWDAGEWEAPCVCIRHLYDVSDDELIREWETFPEEEDEGQTKAL
jgi:hypothetical protein